MKENLILLRIFNMQKFDLKIQKKKSHHSLATLKRYTV